MSCSCKKAAQAAAVLGATAALGPAGTLIAGSVMSSLQQDQSPAGQAQYQAAVEHNKVVTEQNQERGAIIEQMVKDAMGGDLSADDLAFGDRAKKLLSDLVTKYGPEVKNLTLAQAVAKYPADAKAFVQSIGDVFPELRGKSFEEAWAMLPNALKDLTLSDLEYAIPNSTWAGAKTSTGTAVAPGVMSTTAVAIGGIALVGLAFMFLRKKGPNAS